MSLETSGGAGAAIEACPPPKVVTINSESDVHPRANSLWARPQPVRANTLWCSPRLSCNSSLVCLTVRERSTASSQPIQAASAASSTAVIGLRDSSLQ